MNLTHRSTVAAVMLSAITALFSASLSSCHKADGSSQAKDSAPGKRRIAVVGQSSLNGFYEGVHKGALEAAKELGEIEVIYRSSETGTADGQAAVVRELLDGKKLDALAISALDSERLTPLMEEAKEKGIKVISYESDLEEGDRILHIAPSNAEITGRSQVQLMGSILGWKGEVAIICDQGKKGRAILEYMKREFAENTQCRDMKLSESVRCEPAEVAGETRRLLDQKSHLRGLIVLEGDALVTAARVIEATGRAGDIALTGVGSPASMKDYVKSGLAPKLGFWNPIDLGYAVTLAAASLVRGDREGKSGESIEVGRLGLINVGEKGVAIMGEPAVATAGNIAAVAPLFQEAKPE